MQTFRKNIWLLQYQSTWKEKYDKVSVNKERGFFPAVSGT